MSPQPPKATASPGSAQLQAYLRFRRFGHCRLSCCYASGIPVAEAALIDREEGLAR